MPSSPSLEPMIGYIDDLDFIKDFQNDLPVIAYNDLKSKSDPLIEPFVNMAPLPHHDLRHPWLRYQVEGYDEGIVHSYEHILETIFGREVNRVHVLDFAGLIDGMRQTLTNKLSMVYIGDDEEAFFTSHTWRRLYEVRGPLVREFILEFLSTCRMSDTEMGLDEEMAEARFGAYWFGSERVIPDKGDLIDYWTEISFDRDFLGPAPSYVHIRDPGPKRQQAAAAGALGAAEDAPVADEGAQAVPAPVQAP
ncbi:hypothetical protein Tco_0944335 [Tanacetum coccineum]